MVTLGYQIGHDGCRSIAVDVAFLVEEIFDEFSVGDDQRGICEPLEAEDATKCLRPLGQSDFDVVSHQAESS